MKIYKEFWYAAALVGGMVILPSCGGDDPEPDNSYIVPTTYTFTDGDGNNTVNYSGQTARADMLDEIVTAMKKGNTSGVEVSATELSNMFANENSPFSNSELNTSTKQLKNKTLNAEVFTVYIDSLAKASTSTAIASNGVAGVVSSGEKAYLVSANGIEYTQLFEKGLFASCFFNQISNSYLTSDKIGSAVSTDPVDPSNGKYYSTKEHHFDEAFGYIGAPIDFPTTAGRHIAKYSTTVDPILGTNTKIMDAFLKGRAAISNDDQTALDESVVTITENLELVFAGAAIHYLSGAASDFQDDALRMHQLSEAYAFLGGLSISPSAKSTASDVQGWRDILGENLWEVTAIDISNVKDQIATKYGISASDRDAL